jgi:hypothetical protein
MAPGIAELRDHMQVGENLLEATAGVEDVDDEHLARVLEFHDRVLELLESHNSVIHLSGNIYIMIILLN